MAALHNQGRCRHPVTSRTAGTSALAREDTRRSSVVGHVGSWRIIELRGLAEECRSALDACWGTWGQVDLEARDCHGREELRCRYEVVDAWEGRWVLLARFHALAERRGTFKEGTQHRTHLAAARVTLHWKHEMWTAEETNLQSRTFEL